VDRGPWTVDRGIRNRTREGVMRVCGLSSHPLSAVWNRLDKRASLGSQGRHVYVLATCEACTEPAKRVLVKQGRAGQRWAEQGRGG
jgi:hypothetical protein